MTQSSKHVSRSSVFVFARVAALTLSSILFVNFVAWSAGFYGFDLGYGTAKVEYKTPSPETEIIFSAGNPRAYERLSTEYIRLFFLAFLLLGSCIVQLTVKIERVAMATSIINILCAGLILKDLWFFIGLKDPSLNAFLDLPFNALLMQSVKYDWICVFFAVALLLVEVTILKDWFRKRKSASQATTSIQ